MERTSTWLRLAGMPALLLLLLGITTTPARNTSASGAVPTVVLTPDSGPAPDADGTLSGDGWFCASTPYTGGLTVSGPGVTGSASMGRSGSLSGSFTVAGDPGQSRRITVTADTACPSIGPPIYLTAYAIFTFDDPPPTDTDTPTRTPTVAPTDTPPPTAPPPTSTPTSAPPTRPTNTPAPGRPSPTPPPAATATPAAAPTPGGPAPLLSTLTFTGCTPDASEVMLDFVPIMLVDPDGGGVPPGTPGMMVPATRSASKPGAFTFTGPLGAPGAVYLVTPQYDDPKCPDTAPSDAVPWSLGHDIDVANIYDGTYTLEICAVVDKQPCEYVVVKGGTEPASGTSAAEAAAIVWPEAWVMEKNFFPGELGTTKAQYFRFTTDFPSPETLKVELQASVWPFPSGPEADPFAPPGLVAQWQVDCANCEFPIDLSVLDPEGAAAAKAKKTPLKKGDSWYQPVFDIVTAPADGAKKGFDFVQGIFGGGGDDKDDADPAPATAVKSLSNSQDVVLKDGMANQALVPKKFYFRVVMYTNDKTAGWDSDNSVVMQEIPKPDPIKIATPTSAPVVPSAYQAEIISYNGIIPPTQNKYPCYIVTQQAWPADPWGTTYTTDQSKAWPGLKPLQPGHPICEPEPEEPDLFETVMKWVEEGVNWASGAWQDLKQFAVNVVLEFTPLGLQCEALEDAGVIPDGGCGAALSIALDAALVSMGIPPDIPNFDQLMEQGIEYVAVQAAAQMSIPPEVIKAATEEGGPYAGVALNIAEQKLREELEAGIKSKLDQSIKQIQLSYSESISWIPNGVPVRPDDAQPPAAVIRITRLPGMPGGETGCTATVQSGVQVPQEVLTNPPPGWAGNINGLPTKLSSLTIYDFFINDADLITQGWSGGPDKKFTIPALDPGESIDIPMTFRPNIYKNGWFPLGTISTSQYFTAWHIMHEFGTITLSVTGCGGAKYTGDASSIYKK